MINHLYEIKEAVIGKEHDRSSNKLLIVQNP